MFDKASLPHSARFLLFFRLAVALYHVTDSVLLLFYDINLFIKGRFRAQMYVYIYDAKDALAPMVSSRGCVFASHLRSMRNYHQENVKTGKKRKRAICAIRIVHTVRDYRISTYSYT